MSMLVNMWLVQQCVKAPSGVPLQVLPLQCSLVAVVVLVPAVFKFRRKAAVLVTYKKSALVFMVTVVES